MSSDSRSERERLKEEYKTHYREMQRARERYSRAKKTQNISRALKNMDKSEMLESFDDFLLTMKHRLISVEARLDVAMDSLLNEREETASELDEEMVKENARDTLRQVKMEMGLLYKEIERQADAVNVRKTVGSPSSVSGAEDQNRERKY